MTTTSGNGRPTARPTLRPPDKIAVGVDCEFQTHGGAVHAFSDPDVGRYGIPDVAY